MARHCPHNAVPVRDFFDRHAARWDDIVSPDHGRRLHGILETFPIAPGATLLDVGCGTGVLFPILAARLDKTGCVVSVDISGAMMRKTRERMARTEHRCAALAVQADIMAPPLPEGSVDWVLCNSCFPHFEDQEMALRVMAGLLRPGGTVVVCHSESRDAINTLHRNIGGTVGGHELPRDDILNAYVNRAGLHLARLEDRADAFVLAARRET